MRYNYMRNNIAKSSNSIFVILISLFIIVFIIVAYIMLSDNMFEEPDKPIKPTKNKSCDASNAYNESNKNTTCNKKAGSKEVFNIKDNMFTFDEAKSVCDAHDAKLASLEEMIYAYKKGANWCSYGWSEGQLALYPTQPEFWNKLQNEPYRKYECGKPGVNGGYFENQNYKFGANCYGVKPEPKSNELEKDRYGSVRLTARELKTTEYKEQLDKFRISPFNEDKWRG